MADIKEIPVDELKVAVKSLNSILEEGKIKSVGKTKISICEGFVAKIQEFAENEKIEDIPEDALDFFNKYFADEDDSEPTLEDKKSEKKAGKADSKPAAKAGVKKESKPAAKKEKPVKEKKEKVPGIVALAVEAYMEEGIKTVAELEKHLAKKFPGRNIKATLGHVVCVLNHVKQ